MATGVLNSIVTGQAPLSDRSTVRLG
jgi:hypothetical protein